jgi:hypothetical protein
MEFETLAGASDDEMLSLLGLYALPLMVEPDQGLAEGRSGAFATTSTALGAAFEQTRLREIGQQFLTHWGQEISRAVCGNEELYRRVRERGLTQLGASVGLITAALTAKIPALTPYSGLLTVLGAFIAQTGFQAFCRMLAELEAERQK